MTFDDHEIRGWLSTFHRGDTATAPHETSTNTAEAPQPHRGYAREKEVSLFSNSVESLRSSTTLAPRSVAERAPRVQKLPLERDLLDRRNAILRGAWQRIQPLIGAASTYELWRRRNARIATELARLPAFDPGKIGRAWELASQNYGEPIRELSLVQKFLEGIAAARATSEAVAL